VPTPWPSWLIAAHPSQERAPTDEVRAFLVALSTYVVSFDAPENRAGPNVEFIKETFGYPEEDISVEFYSIPLKTARTITLVDSRHARPGSKPFVTRKIVLSFRRRSSLIHWRKRCGATPSWKLRDRLM
jgi:hypothetical protein